MALSATAATACTVDDGEAVDTEIGEAVTTEATTTQPEEDTPPPEEAPAPEDTPSPDESTASPDDSATSTETEGAGPEGAGEPAAAATELYDAFVADDRSAAAEVAEAEAVDNVFEATPGPYALYSDCDSGEFDVSGCLFRDRTTNNTIQFEMERRGETWVVINAFFSPG